MTSITLPRLAGLTLLTALLDQPSLSTNPGSIERVATLGMARSAHTATALATGQVLVAGGMTSGGGGVSTAELFYPADNTVRAVASMADSRAGHTATLLPDGRVLIAGGYNGSYMHSVEIFDPATGRFTRAGNLVEGRSGHTATLLRSGLVLFTGGVGDGWTFLTSAEVYDPATARSRSVGHMIVPRESHTATLLRDGRVLVVGGHNGRRQSMQVHSTAEYFDPATHRFAPAASLAIARHKHDAVSMNDGRVLIIGGADRTDRVHFATTELYSPATGAFAPGPSMAQRRYKIAGTSVVLPGGDLLVTSGARSAELLDVARLAFAEVPGRFPNAYRFAAAAVLPDGDVLITGGYSDGNENTNGVWRFRRR